MYNAYIQKHMLFYYSILLKHFRSHHLVHTDTATGKVLSKTKISNTSTSIQVPSDDSVELAAVASVQCTFVKQTVALFSMTVEIDASEMIQEIAGYMIHTCPCTLFKTTNVPELSILVQSFMAISTLSIMSALKFEVEAPVIAKESDISGAAEALVVSIEVAALLPESKVGDISYFEFRFRRFIPSILVLISISRVRVVVLVLIH